MLKMIYTIILSSFLCVQGNAVTGFPGDTVFRKTNRYTDSVLAALKICSCQLMNVQTGPFETQLVGIFAEKTLEGKPAVNYRLMNGYLRREVFYFRYVFLQSAAVNREIESPMDCTALIKQLRRDIKNLQVYNVMDIDVLSGIAKR
jgi:hypothetical protein